MKKNLLFAFGFIGQIGFSTALPLVFLGLFGRYLDRKWHTGGSYLFLAGLAIATVLVFFIVKNIAKRAMKEFEEINTQPNNESGPKN
ncbi:MAG: AtpZ/AtpI family protein [Candidatus Berkelbacteria bacterium]|nr:AtpZ/AtpI family protein [Candidatus Berkelbacteria bacterium]